MLASLVSYAALDELYAIAILMSQLRIRASRLSVHAGSLPRREG
jgi:hypothetical protein